MIVRTLGADVVNRPEPLQALRFLLLDLDDGDLTGYDHSGQQVHLDLALPYGHDLVGVTYTGQFDEMQLLVQAAAFYLAAGDAQSGRLRLLPVRYVRPAVVTARAYRSSAHPHHLRRAALELMVLSKHPDDPSLSLSRYTDDDLELMAMLVA